MTNLLSVLHGANNALRVTVWLLLCAFSSTAVSSTIEEYTRDMQIEDGFIPLYLDGDSGNIYLEVSDPGQDFYYSVMLATGFGDGQVGLDRGQPVKQAVVRFERHGPRVLLRERNTRFIAGSGDADEQRAVDESFTDSVLVSLPVVAEEGARILVNASSWFLSDMGNVRATLRARGLGEARVDGDRSVISAQNTRAFPMNTEIRALLTFASDNPSATVSRLAPDGRYFTIEQHHSLMQLPEEPLPARVYDPRIGTFSTVLSDYSQGFDQDYRDRRVARWRLVPADPEAYLRGELVEPETPIVFHLDRALREPYRSAYIDGVLWWNVAFEAAGFRNAIQVRDLPDDADPMDARYSVLQIVHRTGTGPSVGPGLRDPRSGELIRAVPRMDSHRSLVNHNIFAGMLPAWDALGVAPQLSAETFAMNRRRQHVAHEVGHTLGLPHNFIASAQERTSVMDYPFPLIYINEQGHPDVSDAYRLTMGYADLLSVRYAYTWYPTPEAEAEGLAEISQEALDRGHVFLTGADAALSGSYPEVTQWVEGETMFDALDRTMAVRRVLMEHFDERAIMPGEPMAWLNQRFAHVYLHHRYSVQGVVKYVGGMQYRYAMRGDGQQATEVIDAERQRLALSRILDVLSPEELAVPERIVALIPPLPSGFDRREPWIDSPAGPALDPLAISRSYAQEVVDNLWHRERLARVASFHHRDASQLSLMEVLAAPLDLGWGLNQAAPGSGQEGDNGHAGYLRVLQRAVVDSLFSLVSDDQVTAEVRDAAHFQLNRLAGHLNSVSADDPAIEAHQQRIQQELRRYLDTGSVPALRTGVMPPIALPWP